MSSIDKTLVVATSPDALRLTMGDSTLPPSSTNWSTPISSNAPTLSRQRTRPVTCWTRRSRIVTASLTGLAVTLATNGTSGATGGVAARDRKRVVEGKRVVVRVDLGGRRVIKKT